MLRIGIYILCMLSWSVIAQELPENAADALKEYVNLREGYKHSSTKEFSRTEQFTMDDWCYAMQKKFPDAFETEYAWYLNGFYYSDSEEHILAAYKKAPKDSRVIKSLFGHYLTKAEQAKAKNLVSEVAPLYSKNTLTYYKDASPSSGVIIASSLKDAIPFYILQFRGEINESVSIICMEFLINKTYANRYSSKLKTGELVFFGNEKEYLRKAMNLGGAQLSSTVSQAYLSGNEENCYLVGLSYKFKPADQLNSLESFWKKVATRNLASLNLTSSEKKLYTNYLPPLLTLYKLKKLKGEKDTTLRNAIVVLGEKVGQTKTVNAILEEYD